MPLRSFSVLSSDSSDCECSVFSCFKVPPCMGRRRSAYLTAALKHIPMQWVLGTILNGPGETLHDLYSKVTGCAPIRGQGLI